MRRTNAVPATLAQGLTLALTVMLTVIGPAGGCRRREAMRGGVSDATFVATMVELRRLDGAAEMDSAARVAGRAAVLQRRGLTAPRLERFAATLADDPARAQALFAQIDSAVTRAATGGTTPPTAPSRGVLPTVP